MKKLIPKSLPNLQLVLLSTASILCLNSIVPTVVLAQNSDFNENPNLELNSDGILDRLGDQVIDFVGDNIQVTDFLTDIFQDFQSVVGDIQTFLSERGIEVTLGDLGLPSLEEAKAIFTEDAELDKLSDLFGSQTGSTFDNRDKLLEQYLRDISEEYSSNSALSEEGQEKITEKISIANSTAETSLTLADDSSTQDVSQNILRNISNQLSLQQQIDAMAMFEMQEDKIGKSLSLQMNSEALTEISKQTTRSQRESIAANRDYLGSIFEITIPGKRD
ncbi:MAG: hypothetical protein QNJ53_17760 [Pleurocapsa sp. MO_192.B19]|nr:hypothetical protein [Pleurocapsa sp. MO_192.B19]